MTQKERIIEQATRMFVAQGIKSVRMDDIAQQTGVSKRTLYELFGDKEGLLFLSMSNYFEQNRCHWSQLGGGTYNVLERMFVVLDDVLEHSETTSRMMENLRKFYPEVYEKLLRESYAQNRLEFRRMFEQGITEGFFIGGIHIDLAIAMFFYTASAITSRRDIMLPEGIAEREAFMQIVSTFFRGIATVKGLEIIDRLREEHRPTDRNNKHDR